MHRRLLGAPLRRLRRVDFGSLLPLEVRSGIDPLARSGALPPRGRPAPGGPKLSRLGGESHPLQRRLLAPRCGERLEPRLGALTDGVTTVSLTKSRLHLLIPSVAPITVRDLGKLARRNSPHTTIGATLRVAEEKPREGRRPPCQTRRHRGLRRRHALLRHLERSLGGTGAQPSLLQSDRRSQRSCDRIGPAHGVTPREECAVRACDVGVVLFKKIVVDPIKGERLGERGLQRLQ
mmetsp:Transcript_48688/g.156743  ORF Transcript_48688/g.156743 Transcript_48688/m.156743 type:complete len:235 (+) Transcript_48688:130-834(+)